MTVVSRRRCWRADSRAEQLRPRSTILPIMVVCIMLGDYEYSCIDLNLNVVENDLVLLAGLGYPYIFVEELVP